MLPERFRNAQILVCTTLRTTSRRNLSSSRALYYIPFTPVRACSQKELPFVCSCRSIESRAFTFRVKRLLQTFSSMGLYRCGVQLVLGAACNESPLSRYLWLTTADLSCIVIPSETSLFVPIQHRKVGKSVPGFSR